MTIFLIILRAHYNLFSILNSNILNCFFLPRNSLFLKLIIYFILKDFLLTLIKIFIYYQAYSYLNWILTARFIIQINFIAFKSVYHIGPNFKLCFLYIFILILLALILLFLIILKILIIIFSFTIRYFHYLILITKPVPIAINLIYEILILSK